MKKKESGEFGFKEIFKKFRKKVDEVEEEYERMVKLLQKEISKTIVEKKEIIGLSFSGTKFKVSAETLMTPSPDIHNEGKTVPHFFTALATTKVGLTKDDGYYFIDRDPVPFTYILKYLRAGCIIHEYNLPKRDTNERILLMKECDFYSLYHLKKYLEENKYELDSKILVKDEDIENFFDVTMWKKWKLLYRGSRDGFGASNFHEKCDGTNKTVTVVLTNNGSIFGGYNHLTWDSVFNNYKYHSDCYLFTINHPDGARRLGQKLGDSSHSIYNHKNNGPTFGGGHDLKICDDCNNTSTGSYTSIGNTYENFGKQHYLNNGVQQFRVVEYELFRM